MYPINLDKLGLLGQNDPKEEQIYSILRLDKKTLRRKEIRLKVKREDDSVLFLSESRARALHEHSLNHRPTQWSPRNFGYAFSTHWPTDFL